MKRRKLKLISTVILILFLYNNLLWALAPETVFDRPKFHRTVNCLLSILETLKSTSRSEEVPLTKLSQIRDGLRNIIGNERLRENLELALDSKNRTIYLYSRKPSTRPAVIYRIYHKGAPAPSVQFPALHTEELGGLIIEIFTRNAYWNGIIAGFKQTTDIELTPEEKQFIHQLVDSIQMQEAKETLASLLPPEERPVYPLKREKDYFGHSNDVSDAISGMVFKVPETKVEITEEMKAGTIPANSEAELNKKVEKEKEHFNLTMDWYIIPYYMEQIAKATDNDRRAIYQSTLDIAKHIKAKIGGGEAYGIIVPGKIATEKRLAISFLIEELNRINEQLKRTPEGKNHDVLIEQQFLISQMIVYMRDGIYLTPGANPGDNRRMIEDEVSEFEEVLKSAEAEESFKSEGKQITRLVSELREKVPLAIRTPVVDTTGTGTKNFKAGRAIFDVVEKMNLAGDETVPVKKFVNHLIEQLELANIAMDMEGDIVLACKSVPHPKIIDRYQKKIGRNGRIRAVVCDNGTPISHFMQTTSQEGLPSVAGARDYNKNGLYDNLRDGETVIVYGFSGKIIQNPTNAALLGLERLAVEEKVFYDFLMDRAPNAAVTQTHVHIDTFANADNSHQVEAGMHRGAEGIGLVRTEYLYDRQKLPTINELVSIFNILAQDSVTKAKNSKKITIRLLDRQLDKSMPCLPSSKQTGFHYYMRDTFGRSVVKDELKALYLAFLQNPNIEIMFPQVETNDNVDFALKLIEEIKAELVDEMAKKQSIGIDIDKYKQDIRETLDKMKIGFMVETPEAVDNIEYILEHCDFVSLGTNDLTELVFGVDRDNKDSIPFFTKLQPKILFCIYKVMMKTREVNKRLGTRKTVSICGDLAKVRKFLPFILAVSDSSLHLSPSMPPIFIPLAKKLIRTLNVEDCRNLFKPLLEAFSPLLERKLDDIKTELDSIEKTHVESIDGATQALIVRTIGTIKRRDDYKEKLNAAISKLFCKKIIDLTIKKYPQIPPMDQNELEQMWDGATSPDLLATLKDDGVINMGELEVVRDTYSIVAEAIHISGIGLDIDSQTRAVEIVTAELLRSMGNENLANPDWHQSKDLPLLGYRMPIVHGIMVQKLGDIFGNIAFKNGEIEVSKLSDEFKQWLVMLKAHGHEIAHLKFGFITNEKDDAKTQALTEFLEKHMGLTPGSIYFGTDLEDIASQSRIDNIVYLGNFSDDEKAQLKTKRVKFVQKNNTGLPIEMNLCLHLLGLKTNQVYGTDGNLHHDVLALYASFINNLKQKKLIDGHEIIQMLAQIKKEGVIKLPEIKKVKELSEELLRERETFAISA